MHSKKTTLLLGLIGILAQGCTVIPNFSADNYVAPLDGAKVIENQTRYTKVLECLAPKIKDTQTNRFAVGAIGDFTGKEDLVNGKRLTQGASLMVMSALSKAGVPLVERFDTSISDMELKYADNKLITDEPEGNNGNYRRLFSGSLPGSDYHIVGGITEVNYNIRSGALDSAIEYITLGSRYFVMNIGIDLRLVNTKTLEVVDVQSLQKQIIGTELRGGYFRLFSEGIVDLTASERTQEPIQRGVRMVLEQAVFNMLSSLYQLDTDHCRELINPAKKEALVADNSEIQSSSKDAELRAPTDPLASPPAVSSPNSVSKTRAIPSTVTPVASPVRPSPGAPSPQASALTQPEPKATINMAKPVSSDDPLQGLVGFDSKDNGEASTSGSSPTDKEMKEKLLWGSKPFLR